MQRPGGFRASHGGFLLPYRYGDRKWEDYLLDTQTLIHDGAREQTEVQERIGQQAFEQRDKQMSLLQEFIVDAEDAWDRVNGQLDTLTDQMVTGFSAVSYQLKFHSLLLQKIVDRLDDIAENIANPLATQANELVRSGQHLMERGLYREAFDDFTEAQAKRSVNPMLHLYLTQLHYHVLDEGVPFDLSAAERHVSLAMRYATSLRDDLEEDGAAVVDLVYRTAAHLALVKGGDLSQSAGPEAGATELRRGDGYLRAIDQPSSSSQFLHAQLLALLDRPDEACAKVMDLADFTRSWIPRALLEPNLASIADRVRALSEELRANPGVHSRKVYQAIAAGRAFAARCSAVAREFNSPSTALSVQITEISDDFEAGAIDAIVAEYALDSALGSAKSSTVALIQGSIDFLDADRKREVSEAENHARRAQWTWNFEGMLAAISHMNFRQDARLIVGGCVAGWILGAMSCPALAFVGLGGCIPQFLYFAIAGPVGAVLLKINEYSGRTITESAAAAERALELSARERVQLLERKVADVKGMRAALSL